MTVHPLSRPEGGAVITHLDITRRRESELEAERLLQELAHVTRVTMLGNLRVLSRMNSANRWPRC